MRGTCSRSAMVLASRMAPFSAVVSSTRSLSSRGCRPSSASTAAILFLEVSVCPTTNASISTATAAAAAVTAVTAAATAALSVPAREGGALRSAASRLSARSSGQAHGLSSYRAHSCARETAAWLLEALW
jgi:hypothetical protein